ncbi:MAG: polysaccharide deacetylase family protein [Deltaproteobacteria bacterium]|nr:polysaccharide deacetylase family protein [Deltaproteobacteria bacterium]
MPHYGIELGRRFLVAASPRFMGTITHVATRHPVAALTFDGGPDPNGQTPRLLCILKRHQAHATFFMIGKYAQIHPEIVKQVAMGAHYR